MDDIMKIATEEDFRDFKTVTKTRFSTRNFTALPLFMINSINEAILRYNGDSTQILVMAIKEVKEFDKHVAKNTNEPFEKVSDTYVWTLFFGCIWFQKERSNQSL